MNDASSASTWGEWLREWMGCISWIALAVGVVIVLIVLRFQDASETEGMAGTEPEMEPAEALVFSMEVDGGVDLSLDENRDTTLRFDYLLGQFVDRCADLDDKAGAAAVVHKAWTMLDEVGLGRRVTMLDFAEQMNVAVPSARSDAA